MSNVDLEQGEEYEENSDYYDDEEYDEDDDVETVYDTIYGIKKEYIMIGAVVLIVLVIAVVVIASWASKKKETDSEVFVSEDNDDVFSYGDTYYSDDDDIFDYGDTDDDIFDYGDFEEYDPSLYEEPDIEDISTEDMILLRSYGYTGDEIEYSISHGFSVEAMVERSKAEMDEANRESWVRTSDAASAEYKYLLENTYLSQPEAMPVSDQDELEFMERVDRTRTEEVNCDYVKCPMNGLQLYLKCKVATDIYYWYPIDPSRWCKLPDRGNIVLKVTYREYGDGLYITGATEVDNTLSTVETDGVTTVETPETTESSGESFLTE